VLQPPNEELVSKLLLYTVVSPGATNSTRRPAVIIMA
jgi:hypothetical protein